MMYGDVGCHVFAFQCVEFVVMSWSLLIENR